MGGDVVGEQRLLPHRAGKCLVFMQDVSHSPLCLWMSNLVATTISSLIILVATTIILVATTIYPSVDPLQNQGGQ